MHNCEGESAPEAEDMKVGQGFLKHTIPFPWLVDVGVSDTGLSGTPLMSSAIPINTHSSLTFTSNVVESFPVFNVYAETTLVFLECTEGVVY